MNDFLAKKICLFHSVKKDLSEELQKEFETLFKNEKKESEKTEKTETEETKEDSVKPVEEKSFKEKVQVLKEKV